MTHNLDDELAGLVPALPVSDLADIPAAREAERERRRLLRPPDPTGVDWRDRRVPGREGTSEVEVRIYRPHTGRNPVGILDIHGGGFVVGSVDSTHATNLELARRLGATVVSVGYRLAPEHRYPAALEDCWAALCWLAEQAPELGIDPSRIAVHGLSAGGGLAAGVTLLARDRGGPKIAFQYLSVPELDDRLDSPSMRAYTDTPIWTNRKAEISWDAYLGPGRRGTESVPAYAAPARTTDLSGLPPTYVSAMHYDPLRDEDIAYASALLAAGVPTELHVFPGTFHGSAMLDSRISRRETEERIAVLGRGLGI